MLVESNCKMSYDLNHKIKQNIQNFKCHNAQCKRTEKKNGAFGLLACQVYLLLSPNKYPIILGHGWAKRC